MVDFGQRIKALRLQKKLTQAELAQQLGVTKSVISAYEAGLRMPSYDILIRLARIFKVSTDYLLGVEARVNLDLSGLTDEEAAALIKLIQAMKAN